MKDEDIKLPEVPKQFTKIWSAISSWQHAPDDSSECIQFANEIDAAIIALIKEQCFAAVRLNQLSAVGERKPFDLEAAKDGAKLVTRGGCPVRFVAHVPEAQARYQLVCMLGQESIPYFYPSNGSYLQDGCESAYDLFLAPDEPVSPRVMWMNEFQDGRITLHSVLFEAEYKSPYGKRPIKVEIREVE